MLLPHQKTIGLFDSGLGGLTVLRELQRALPSERFAYLGDNARFPYGTKSPETIVRYSRECAAFLMQRDVGVIVVACNTASSTALSVLEAELSVPVIGTVEPAARSALAATRSGTIGVLGTNATVASGVYESALKRLNPALKVTSQACPLFVSLVEAGMFDGEIVEKVVDLYLAPLKAQAVDTVILGCTHYPLLLAPIKRYLGDTVAVVECSKAMLQDVKKVLGPSEASVVAPSTSYYVTDAVGQFNQLAALFLGHDGVQASKVELEVSSPAETPHLRAASS